MARKLPPLNALRAFDAAAHHLSFTRAAAELFVTHGAVSRQIRLLEEWLGVALFRREHRAVVLTEAGQAYAQAVRESLDRLAEATQQLRARDRAGRLNVATSDSFAALWLVPRLGRFRAQHAEVDLRLSTSDRLIDLAREGFDMAIRYGRGVYPGLEAEHLMTEDLSPVCSPALLEGPEGLRRPEDLGRVTLLHDDMRQDWRMWLMAAGIEGIDSTRGPSYEHSNLVIQAAVQGEGVALGRGALVAGDLAAGRLVQPFDISLRADFAYYVVHPPGALARPKVRAFRDWLMEEAGAAT